MFRRFLTYQLIVAVAVGQLLCCCTAVRLLAAPPVPTQSTPLAAPEAPRPKISHSCCSHRQASEQAPTQKTPDQKPSPQKPSEKCPCKDHAYKAVATTADSASSDVSSLLRLVASFDFGILAPFNPFCAATRALCKGADRSRDRCEAALSTDDILFAHHNLRC